MTKEDPISINNNGKQVQNKVYPKYNEPYIKVKLTNNIYKFFRMANNFTVKVKI